MRCDNCETKCEYLEEKDEDYDLCCQCNDDIPEDEYCSDCFSSVASDAYDMIKGQMEKEL